MAFCRVESIMEPKTSVKGSGFSLGLPIINKKAPANLKLPIRYNTKPSPGPKKSAAIELKTPITINR